MLYPLYIGAISAYNTCNPQLLIFFSKKQLISAFKSGFVKID